MGEPPAAPARTAHSDRRRVRIRVEAYDTNCLLLYGVFHCPCPDHITACTQTNSRKRVYHETRVVIFVCDAMGRDCFGLPQGTGLVRAQRMYLLLWVAVSLVGADRLAHARNRTPLPSSCSSSPRFATEPTDRTQLRVLHAADPHTLLSFFGAKN